MEICPGTVCVWVRKGVRSRKTQTGHLQAGPCVLERRPRYFSILLRRGMAQERPSTQAATMTAGRRHLGSGRMRRPGG